MTRSEKLKRNRIMSKAEKFIQDCTRNCSQLHYNSACTLRHCITPDQARRAVEIAREEVIEMVVEFLSKEDNIPLWDDNSGDFGCDNSLLIKKLKHAIKDE